jgi:hypothetical protein
VVHWDTVVRWDTEALFVVVGDIEDQQRVVLFAVGVL